MKNAADFLCKGYTGVLKKDVYSSAVGSDIDKGAVVLFYIFEHADGSGYSIDMVNGRRINSIPYHLADEYIDKKTVRPYVYQKVRDKYVDLWNQIMY